MKIAITRNISSDLKFQKYIDYLQRFDQHLVPVILTHDQNNSDAVADCSGVLLTGGDDVHPKLYGREASTERAVGPDVERDLFEYDVIKLALEMKKPVYGICRGLQVMNVYLGGSLHIDLQSAGFQRHTSLPEQETVHEVRVVKGTLLDGIAGIVNQKINSYHHQAVDTVSPELIVNAVSPDGVIEGLEWKEKGGKAYLLLVQWHPERMMDNTNPFTGKTGQEFLNAMHKH
jgi:putative glutamine amidotransferase